MPPAKEKAPRPKNGQKEAAAAGPRMGKYWRARALYEFIRAILGDRVSDNEIARRWRIDPQAQLRRAA